jgi:outer membrane protein W
MKKILLILTFIAAALFSSAQDNSFRITYDVAIPTGQMSSDFINSTSWRGISIDNRWGIKPNLTVGFLLGWQVFAQRFDNVTEVTSDGLVTFHGTQFRTINSFPLQANAHYYFGEEDGIRPWVGLGIGTAYSDQRMQVGFFETRTNVWSFTTTPQMGIDIPINHQTSFTLHARFNYFNHDAVSFNYSFMVFGAGIKFAYW